MIGNLNHVAIVVPNLEKAKFKYEGILGATVSGIEHLEDHGVSIIFVKLGNTKIELMHPLGDKSPIKKFLEKNPNGAIHHVCYEVKNIKNSIKLLQKKGIEIIGDSSPSIGAHGKPVVFLKPKQFDGTLIELEEV
ncbi:MAG: hypothetical protein CFH01_01186 [Alphaproteobacteria bacterium MarineAlpha2_Bin1]|nr:MAG: hypothetical protein CFH01_01186 [Alphaproteobacteria bacterium MarineAlpha2_Bin1]|tara:strand:- start:51 stop:455 length:405 start_codon:yes stop_codon:yes gene_type:complete